MSSLRFTVHGRTDQGKSRARNEDAFFAGRLPGTEDWTLLAVADGLGGHAAGDWASTRTIELLSAELGPAVLASGPEAALREACRRINWAIHSEAQARGTRGAATTLVLALVQGDQFWWLNVGDSRLYLLGEGGLRQVSTDHSWVEERIAAGQLERANARLHPNRNVVTRTIGFEPRVEPDVAGPLTLEPGDSLLACSDGLFGPVSDEEIAVALADEELADACRRLIDLANAAGGPDNITVAIGRLEA